MRSSQGVHSLGQLNEQTSSVEQVANPKDHILTILYRQLVPVPLVDYGVAYLRDSRSAVLANLLGVADGRAQGWSGEVPPGGRPHPAARVRELDGEGRAWGPPLMVCV